MCKKVYGEAKISQESIAKMLNIEGVNIKDIRVTDLDRETNTVTVTYETERNN